MVGGRKAEEPGRRKASKSLSDQAYTQLKALILSNALQAGRYMLEDEVAKIVEMSRTPMREALIKLEHDGLISIIPRRGIRIQTLTLNDLKEIYALLEVVEAMAIQTLVASPEHRDRGNRLVKLVDRMDASLERNDLNEWATSYSEFHTSLVAFSGMSRLEKLASTLLDQSHRVRLFTLRVRERPVNVNQNQRILAEAIRNGDPVQALDINRIHSLRRIEEIADIFHKLDFTEL